MESVFPRRDAPVDYLMALRGIALLGVMLGHLFSVGFMSVGALVTKSEIGWERHAAPFDIWRTVVEIVTPFAGLNFVILFFVLSGYLMGKVFFEGRHDAVSGKGEFYFSRFLRLAPLLYFNLLICLALVPFAVWSPLMVAGDFLFITNLTGRGVNAVTWSLSHEMQYYLAAPFVFLLFRHRRRWALHGALLLALVGLLIGRFVPPLAYVGCFLAGFAINLMKLPAISPTAKRLLLAAGLAVLHLGFNGLYFLQLDDAAILLSTVASVGLVATADMALDRREKPSLFLRFAACTGALTYGLYLWHYVIDRSIAVRLERLLPKYLLDFADQVAAFTTLEFLLVPLLSYPLSYFTFVTIERYFRPSLYQPRRPETPDDMPIGLASAQRA